MDSHWRRIPIHPTGFHDVNCSIVKVPGLVMKYEKMSPYSMFGLVSRSDSRHTHLRRGRVWYAYTEFVLHSQQFTAKANVIKWVQP